MTYKAIAAHWNGACYSPDGEDWAYYQTLQDAIAAADNLLGIYEEDVEGNPADVDLQWQIFDDDDEDMGPVKVIRVDSQAAERAQEECESIASEQGEFSTEYVGTGPAGELVRWTVNGGYRGAHQGDQNRGGRDTAMMPESIEPKEWLRLAVSMGFDDVDTLTDPALVDLEDLEGDADEQVVYWLDAAGGKWKLPCYSLDLGRKRLVWSNADEAGLADEALIDPEDWEGFAERLAKSLGELADAE